MASWPLQESTRLAQHHFDAARWEVARPAGRTALHAAAAEGAQPLDQNWLQARIAAPLSARLRHTKTLYCKGSPRPCLAVHRS